MKSASALTAHQRIGAFLLAALALADLLFGLWALPHLQRPYLGYIFDAKTSMVLEVAPHSPAAVAGLKPGDIITQVDGKPTHDAMPHDGSKPVGEPVRVSFTRGGEQHERVLWLVYPSLEALAQRATYYTIALAFWLLGVMAFVNQWAKPAARSFLVLCLTGAGILWVLPFSSVGIAWTGKVMGTLNLLAGVSFLHFHTLFPRPVTTPTWSRVVKIVYLLGATLALIGISLSTEQLADWAQALGGPGASWASPIQGFFVTTVALGLALLLSAYREGAGDVRRRVRLIVFGTVLGFTPMLVCYTAQMGGVKNVPYELAILCLLAIPVVYTISIRQTDLMATDSRLYRVLAPLLTAILLLAGYFGLLVLFRLAGSRSTQSELVEAVAGLTLAFSFTPTRHLVQRSLYRLFYGPKYDYIEALAEGTQALTERLDKGTLVQVLTQRIPAVMGISQAGLWIADESGQLRWVAGSLAAREPGEAGAPFWSRAFCEALGAGHPIQQAWNEKESAFPRLTGPARWWIPLLVSGELQAVWVVGPKHNDESFSPIDTELLERTAHQLAFATKAVRLVELVRQDLAQTVQAREAERERLSHELHDEVIQSLNGFKLFLQVARHQASEEMDVQLRELQGQTRGIIEQIRAICQGLRPRALQERGLIGALGALCQELEHSGVIVTSKIQPQLEVGDETEVAIYRIAQEALTNIRKHAGAQRVDFCLSLREHGVALTVRDDGRGFGEEARTRSKQLGLSVMRDRAAALGGTLRLESAPGGGTMVEAYFSTLCEQEAVAA